MGHLHAQEIFESPEQLRLFLDSLDSERRLDGHDY